MRGLIAVAALAANGCAVIDALGGGGGVVDLALPDCGAIGRRYGAPITASPGDGGLTFLVATGDVDGDGFADVVSASNQSIVRVFRGQGDGTIATTPLAHQPQGLVQRFAVADVDGDGHADAIMTLTNGLAVSFGQPGGGLGPEVALGGNPDTALAVGQFDGDGVADVVAATGDTVQIFSHTAPATIASRTTFTLGPGGGPGPLALAAGDLDGDGRDDLRVAVPGRQILGEVQDAAGFLKRATSGDLSLAPDLTVAAMISPDLDHDGRADVVALIDQPGGASTIGISLSRQGDGLVRYQPSPALGVSGLASADLDLDGVPDLVFASNGGATGAVVWLTDDRGQPHCQERIDLGPIEAIAAGNLDGDPQPDLVAAAGDRGVMWLLSSTASGP